MNIAVVGESVQLCRELFSKIIELRQFSGKEIFTLFTYNIDGKRVRLWFFGEHSLAPSVLFATQGKYSVILFVFDLASTKGLGEASRYLSRISEVSKVYLVGVKRNGVKVPLADVRRLLKHREGINYIEVDLSTGENLDKLRSMLVSPQPLVELLAERRGLKPVIAPVEKAKLLPVVKQVAVKLKDVEGLSDEERKVLELCTGEYSIEEIAERLNMPRIKVALILRKLERKNAVKLVYSYG